MPEASEVDALVTRVRLLADPTRLRILWALHQGESDVGCLAELANSGAAAVSQHLAKLRLAGVVKARRHGQHVVYELIDSAVQDLLDDLVGHSRPAGRAPSPTGRP